MVFAAEKLNSILVADVAVAVKEAAWAVGLFCY